MTTNHPFEGTWQPVHAELNGEAAPPMMLEKMEVELANGTYVVRFGGVAADHGTYEVDDKGITLRGVSGPNAGKTIPCIFKVVDGRLVMCYGLGGVRPQTYGGATSAPFYVATYARKPAK
jgi:uncharacterized protein (TIGR03067 family)